MMSLNIHGVSGFTANFLNDSAGPRLRLVVQFTDYNGRQIGRDFTFVLFADEGPMVDHLHDIFLAMDKVIQSRAAKEATEAEAERERHEDDIIDFKYDQHVGDSE